MLSTLPIQRRLVFAMASLAVGALAGGGPDVSLPAARLQIPPAVREIVRTLHIVDLPARWRRRNWIGNRGQGSCVHASLVHLLHWQGRHDLADWWQRQYANGETAEGLARKLEAAGIQFAETRAGDEAFLEWALRTRRGAAVVVQNGAHMVNLVGLDADQAFILDSNSPAVIQTWNRAAFLADWRKSGGWAVTPVGTPPSPSPWLVKG